MCIFCAQELRAAVKRQERTLAEQHKELLGHSHAVTALAKRFSGVKRM